VVREFPVFIGLIVVMGLISAGLSTLEGLIQAVSTTITADIVKPFYARFRPAPKATGEKTWITVNKVVIAGLAVISAFISYDQLINPKLSVGIFAQNGVYAYFSAAFLPILFGMFLKNVPKAVPIAASLTAVIVHFTVYFGKVAIPLSKSTGENPGVAAAVAIITSVIVGSLIYAISARENRVQA
jgi:sodium/pantothenate symporter